MGIKKNILGYKKTSKIQVCVTGATGFVGNLLVEKLLNEGYVVRILSRNNNHKFSKKVEIFVGDLSEDTINLNQFFQDCDIFFHCAGQFNNAKKMYNLHVNGTKRLVKAFCAQKKISGKIPHWVQLSSVGTYGRTSIPGNEETITEATGLNPCGSYEITKAESDKYLIYSARVKGFTYSILRPSNIVGFNMKNKSLIAMLKKIKKNHFFFIGSKKTISNYIHVDDVVDAMFLCCKSDRAKNQIFNLSNDCMLIDIVKIISHSNGECINYKCFPERLIRVIVFLIPSFLNFPLSKSRIDALVSRTSYPSSKIKNFLGFLPSKSILKFTELYLRKLDD